MNNLKTVETILPDSFAAPVVGRSSPDTAVVPLTHGESRGVVIRLTRQRGDRFCAFPSRKPVCSVTRWAGFR